MLEAVWNTVAEKNSSVSPRVNCFFSDKYKPTELYWCGNTTNCTADGVNLHWDRVSESNEPQIFQHLAWFNRKNNHKKDQGKPIFNWFKSIGWKSIPVCRRVASCKSSISRGNNSTANPGSHLSRLQTKLLFLKVSRRCSFWLRKVKQKDKNDHVCCSPEGGGGGRGGVS